MNKTILAFLLVTMVIGCTRPPIGVPLPNGSRFQKQWKHYVRLQPHKAIAVAGSMSGLFVAGYSFVYTSESDAIEAALADCEARRADRRIVDPCRMFAVGNDVPVIDEGAAAVIR